MINKGKNRIKKFILKQKGSLLFKVLGYQFFTLICQAFNFLYSVQIAHALTLQDRGILGNDILYLGLIFSVANAGLNEYIPRRLRDGEGLDMRTLIIAPSILSSFLFMICYALDIFGLSIKSLIFMSISAIFYYFSTMALNYIWSIGHIRFINLMRILNALYGPFLIVLLSSLNLLIPEYIVIGIYAQYIIWSILYFYIIRRRNINFFDNNRQNNFQLIFFNFVSTSIVMILINADKIFINNMIISSGFAKYLIAIAIYTPLVELLASASLVLIISVKKTEDISKKIIFGFFIYAIIFLIVGNVFIKVLPLIFGEKYSDSVSIGQNFSVMFLFLVFYRILDSVIRIYKINYSVIINLIAILIFAFGLVISKRFIINPQIDVLAYSLTAFFIIVVLIQCYVYKYKILNKSI